MAESPGKNLENLNERTVMMSQNPTTFADIVHMAVRSDQTVLLQFISKLESPEFFIENNRTVITLNTAKSLVDSLSKIINHYPKKPRAKKTPK